MPNKTIQDAQELSQLSRFVFDDAAKKWYIAIGLEILGGVIAAAFSLATLAAMTDFIGSILTASVLVIAYVFRLLAAGRYGAAETMRRQSVLSEALEWPVDTLQMSEWRDLAGKNLRERVKMTPRTPDYYSTKQTNPCHRLAEMTMESAFYTRHLYKRILKPLWVLCVVAILLTPLLLFLALAPATPMTVSMAIAQTILLLVPSLIGVDLLGWAIRLSALIDAIRRTEEALDRITTSGAVDSPNVMRLVSEYNCQVVVGVPILNCLFHRWHSEIDELWGDRASVSN